MSNSEYNQALARADYRLSVNLNRLGESKSLTCFFNCISRCGDGAIWYGVIVILPVLKPSSGLAVSLQLSISTLVGIAVYKLIKHNIHRSRPFCQHGTITRRATVLDEWSFPSGHTLHASSFTTILWTGAPDVALCFLPFAVLTAVSRIILGLHYPTDVLAGGMIGTAIGAITSVLSRAL